MQFNTKRHRAAVQARLAVLQWLDSDCGRAVTNAIERKRIRLNLDRVPADFLLRYRTTYDLAFMLLCVDFLDQE